MAKVKRVDHIETVQWKPYVDVSLSKREAIGLMALMYVAPTPLVRGGLYNLLKECLNLLVDENELDDITDGISINYSNDVHSRLDDLFGKV